MNSRCICAVMQGLLRNLLADGSTMGVSSGAALGAIIAVATGFVLPGFFFGGSMVMAMAFAFGSLILILSLAWMQEMLSQWQEDGDRFL